MTEYSKLETGEFKVVETKVRPQPESARRPAAEKISGIRFATGKRVKTVKKSNKRDEDDDLTFKSLLAKTAVCAAAVLVLLAVKAMDTPASKAVGDTVASAVSESVIPEDMDVSDIGRLKFVENIANALPVMSPSMASSGYGAAYPVSGTIAKVFDGEKNNGLTFDVEAGSSVYTATDGLVCEVTPFEVKVGMDDGAIVGYKGVTPSVEIGENVAAGDLLGKATSDEVVLSVVVDNKAVDPFSVLENLK